MNYTLSKIHIYYFILLLLSCMLTSCSQSYSFTDEQRVKPYTVKGITYYPILHAAGFEQTGIASWYGPGFHGKKTASGEIFNMNAVTAAHKELPLGSYVFVENIASGKKIKVKINDRGPFIENRVIDLSKGAAIKLGVYDIGVAQVRITHESSSEIETKDNSTDEDFFTSFLNKANDYIYGDTEEKQSVIVAQNPPTSSTSSSQPKVTQNSTSTTNSSNTNSSNTNSSTVKAKGTIFIHLEKYKTEAEAVAGSKTVQHLGFPFKINSSFTGYTLQAGPFEEKQDAINKRAVLMHRFPKAKVL